MSEPTKKLFLLDAMALIYRAFYALNKNPRINSKGLNTSAILGFANALLDILKNDKPTHIGVAFDTMAPTVRHGDFPEYKGNRQAMPEDLSNRHCRGWSFAGCLLERRGHPIHITIRQA